MKGDRPLGEIREALRCKKKASVLDELPGLLSLLVDDQGLHHAADGDGCGLHIVPLPQMATRHWKNEGVCGNQDWEPIRWGDVR